MHTSRTTLTTSGVKFATGLRRRKTATTLDTNVRFILRNGFVLKHGTPVKVLGLGRVSLYRHFSCRMQVSTRSLRIPRLSGLSPHALLTNPGSTT